MGVINDLVQKVATERAAVEAENNRINALRTVGGRGVSNLETYNVLYKDLVAKAGDPFHYIGPDQYVGTYTVDGLLYTFGDLYAIQFPEENGLRQCYVLPGGSKPASCEVDIQKRLLLNPLLYGFAKWNVEFEDVMFMLYNKGITETGGLSQIFNLETISLNGTHYIYYAIDNVQLSEGQLNVLKNNFSYAIHFRIISPGTFVEDVYLPRLIKFLKQSKTLDDNNATLQAIAKMDSFLPGFKNKMTKKYATYQKDVLMAATKEVLDSDAINQEYCSSKFLTLSTDSKESLKAAGYDVDKLEMQCSKFNALAGVTASNAAANAHLMPNAPVVKPTSKLGLVWPLLIIGGLGIGAYLIFRNKQA
jgi:hypothetical protein